MARGSTGTNTGTIIYTRGRRKRKRTDIRRCNCMTCIHAVVKNGVADCMITGDVAVHKSYCEYYKNSKYFQPKKVNNK